MKNWTFKSDQIQQNAAISIVFHAAILLQITLWNRGAVMQQSGVEDRTTKSGLAPIHPFSPLSAALSIRPASPLCQSVVHGSGEAAFSATEEGMKDSSLLSRFLFMCEWMPSDTTSLSAGLLSLQLTLTILSAPAGILSDLRLWCLQSIGPAAGRSCTFIGGQCLCYLEECVYSASTVSPLFSISVMTGRGFTYVVVRVRVCTAEAHALSAQIAAPRRVEHNAKKKKI